MSNTVLVVTFYKMLTMGHLNDWNLLRSCKNVGAKEGEDV